MSPPAIDPHPPPDTPTGFENRPMPPGCGCEAALGGRCGGDSTSFDMSNGRSTRAHRSASVRVRRAERGVWPGRSWEQIEQGDRSNVASVEMATVAMWLAEVQENARAARSRLKRG